MKCLWCVEGSHFGVVQVKNIKKSSLVLCLKSRFNHLINWLSSHLSFTLLRLLLESCLLFKNELIDWKNAKIGSLQDSLRLLVPAWLRLHLSTHLLNIFVRESAASRFKLSNCSENEKVVVQLVSLMFRNEYHIFFLFFSFCNTSHVFANIDSSFCCFAAYFFRSLAHSRSWLSPEIVRL